MGYAIAHQVSIEIETCCACGVAFGMPAEFQCARRSDGEWFYCPAGHRQHYTETEAQRLRKMLDEANRKNTMLAKDVRDAQEAEQRQAAAREKAEREAKRLRKRAQAGACPCCTRTFQNLARHMATKHPEQAESKQ